MFSQACVGSQGLASAPASGDGKKKRQEDKQVCLPVTVRAIESALQNQTEGGTEVKFYGREQGMLILVAAVEAVVTQGVSVEMFLNDATGRIKARHYTNDISQQAVDQLTPGCYVHVFGNIRTTPEVHFAITGLRIVTSADDVSFHMIEVAHAAMKSEKPESGRGLDRSVVTPVKAAPTSLDTDKFTKTEISPPKEPSPAVVSTAAPVPPAKNRLQGEALRSAVLEFLRKECEGKPAGVRLRDAVSFADPTPAEDVKATLAKLVDAGDVYNTIDDQHFAVI
jgi:hypothetical protein